MVRKPTGGDDVDPGDAIPAAEDTCYPTTVLLRSKRFSGYSPDVLEAVLTADTYTIREATAAVTDYLTRQEGTE